MALTFNIYTIVVFSYGSNSPLLKIDQRSAIIILNKCSISNAHKRERTYQEQISRLNRVRARYANRQSNTQNNKI